MRKLASIRTVESVHSIPDADKIEMIVIDGWQVVSQKGNFKAGDKCVYFEIDSAFEKDSVVGLSLPVEKAIRVNTEDKGFIEGFRIKTIKLRGQISQGYALPLSYFRSFKNVNLDAEDLTFELNVLKYDKPESGFGMGPGFARTAGNFPTDFIRKTDQERAQNLKHQIFEHYQAGTCFEVTYKLDGSSETIGRYEQGDEVKDVICSRNLALKLDEEDTTSQFVTVGRPILNKLIEGQHVNVALQGELVSPGIQKNFENVLNPALYVYSVWDVKGYKYLNPSKAREFVAELGATYVPVMHENITLQELFGEQVADANELLAKLLDYAEGPSGLNGKYREGLVYKSEDGTFSFKTISNSYLLKEK
jgi:RNA ligase (TIGR02306 family)